LEDVVGVDSKKKAIVDFLKGFPKDKRAAILIGPPGVGKTTLVYAVARDLNRDIIEINASDSRKTDDIKKRIGETTKSKSLTDFFGTMKGKIILVDEVDGISGNEDKGGIQALHDLIQKTEFPIIMTCNEKLPKLKPLIEVAEKIEFKSVQKESIKKVLDRIVKAENLQEIILPETIESLAANAGGDFRSAINDLQSIAMGNRNVSIEENDQSNAVKSGNAAVLLTHSRDDFISAYEGVTEAFSKKDVSSIRRIIDEIDLPSVKSNYERDTILSFFLNNFHKVTDDYNAIAASATMLANADQVLKYIRENQDWSVLGYFYDYLAAGVAIVTLSTKKEAFTQKVDRPEFRFVRDSSPTEMIDKIQETLDSSIRDIKREILPFLKELLDADNAGFQDEFFAWLALDTPGKKKISNWLKK
jgi:replication factor C large subunit